MREVLGQQFMDVRDKNGQPARLGAGYDETGNLVITQGRPVGLDAGILEGGERVHLHPAPEVHLSVVETVRWAVILQDVMTESQEYRS